MKKFYFAYGSNMDIEQMKERKIEFESYKKGVLDGYRLKFNKISSRSSIEGYANIVKDQKSSVEGICYKINNKDLSKLDKCEGVPNHYERKKIKIKIENKKNLKEIDNVITYIAHPDKIGENLKPRKEYLNHLLQAKSLLSDDYYQMLKKTETLD